MNEQIHDRIDNFLINICIISLQHFLPPLFCFANRIYAKLSFMFGSLWNNVMRPVVLLVFNVLLYAKIWKHFSMSRCWEQLWFFKTSFLFHSQPWYRKSSSEMDSLISISASLLLNTILNSIFECYYLDTV